MSELVKPKTLEGYALLDRFLDELRERDRVAWITHVAVLARIDLYFLIRSVLSTKDWVVNGVKGVHHQWWLDRCRDVESGWDRVVDVWSRGHGKTTIKSWALPIQLLLNDRESRIGIGSFRAASALSIVSRIKQELEGNPLLHEIAPDTFYADPRVESPGWSVRDGLRIRRLSVHRTPSVMGYGFIEGLPVGEHFTDQLFDDLVTRDNSRSPEMRAKASGMLAQAFLLRDATRYRMSASGTYYGPEDLHNELPEKGWTTRLRVGVDRDLPAPDGHIRMEVKGVERFVDLSSVVGGHPLYMDPLELAKLAVELGPSAYAEQVLCDPFAGDSRRLDSRQVRRFGKPRRREGMNNKTRYLLADLAFKSADPKKHDPCAYAVIGLGADKNVYLLDGLKDWLDPKSRLETLIDLYKTWSPITEVRIDDAGGLAELAWLPEMQDEASCRFGWQLCPTRGDQVSGGDQKIATSLDWWHPLLSAGRFWVPDAGIEYTRRDGKRCDLVAELIAEMDGFPLSSEDHLLDAGKLLRHLTRKVGYQTRDVTRPLVWPRWPTHSEEALSRARRRPAERHGRRNDVSGMTL